MLGKDCASRQLRKALTEEYPYLLPRSMKTGEVHPDYDYTHIVGEYDIPEGWLVLFLQCCIDIKEPLVKAGCLDNFRFMQVKEKYGSLRLYVHGATDEVHGILSKYEFLSQQVCCECGKPASVMTSGWICPYCTKHVRGGMENVAPPDKLIEIKTSYIRERRSPEGTLTEVIDCTEEWRRYLERIGYTDD